MSERCSDCGAYHVITLDEVEMFILPRERSRFVEAYGREPSGNNESDIRTMTLLMVTSKQGYEKTQIPWRN
jgi:hypothetical protein